MRHTVTNNFGISDEEFNRAVGLIRRKQVAEGCGILLDRMQRSSGETHGMVGVALLLWDAGFRDEAIEALQGRL